MLLLSATPSRLSSLTGYLAPPTRGEGRSSRRTAACATRTPTGHSGGILALIRIRLDGITDRQVHDELRQLVGIARAFRQLRHAASIAWRPMSLPT